VELYAGPLDPTGAIAGGAPSSMALASAADGTADYRGTLVLEASGRRGFTVRVVPDHPDLAPLPEPGLVRWAE
jgi:starch phosphorylase